MTHRIHWREGKQFCLVVYWTPWRLPFISFNEGYGPVNFVLKPQGILYFFAFGYRCYRLHGGEWYLGKNYLKRV